MLLYKKAGVYQTDKLQRIIGMMACLVFCSSRVFRIESVLGCFTIGCVCLNGVLIISHPSAFYDAIKIGGIEKSRKFGIKLVGWAIAHHKWRPTLHCS